ncbi:MAG: ATP-dependent Clp protease proteolytic subunit [Deltaproteobacteria bacterium]|jgi:ATP-dependent Clp protease protease subunit|nr:ATP-dependent Clp protease proteolytic subunit [Deltaproteobacteria bacterium]
MTYIPRIVEQTHRGSEQWDPFSRLFKDRIIFIGSAIDDFSANAVIAQLLYLDSDDPDKEVNIYINSPGGSITAGMAIYDTMQFIQAPISTICIGQAASMAAVLLAAGAKGKRYALPHARIMLHQPHGGLGGQATDIDIAAREVLFLKSQLLEVISKHTGQSIEKLRSDTDRDFYLRPAQAVEYGVVDQIVARKG